MHEDTHKKQTLHLDNKTALIIAYAVYEMDRPCQDPFVVEHTRKVKELFHKSDLQQLEALLKKDMEKH